MRILLIQPPVRDFYQTGIRTYPLGLAYLAAMLLEHGFEVEILDAHDPARRQTIALPAGFGYMRRYYALDNKSPYKLFGHYYHFGLELAEIEAQIRRHRPDLVGIAALFTPYSELAIDLARLTKAIDPAIITVMGGAHVWSMPQHVLASGAVDFIVRGEAEWSFLHLCRELAATAPDSQRLRSIAGLGYLNGGSMYLHADYARLDELDNLPLPARHLLDAGRYTIAGRNYTTLLTSRGCPHSCGFCALSATPCAVFRRRSPKLVLAEVEDCRRRFGIDHFDIEDDNFTAHHPHAAEILAGFGRHQGAGGRLSAMNGVSACNLTPDLLAQMKTAGFSHLDLALVTNSLGQRRAINRPGTLAQFDDMLDRVEAWRFKTTVHIILGLPEDSIANMLQTILYLMTRPCLIGANIYYPVPGSTLFKQHRHHVRYDEPPFWRSTMASCEAYAGQRDEYMTLFYLVRIINYIKGLLPRLGGAGLTPAVLIADWFDKLLAPADRRQLTDHAVSRAQRFNADQLGVFMLQRLATGKQLERVTINKAGQGVVYLFTDEFCRPEIIEAFRAAADSRPIAAPGGNQ